MSLDDVYGRRAARREALGERPVLPWDDDKYPLALELPARIFAEQMNVDQAVYHLIVVGEREAAAEDKRAADPDGVWQRFLATEPTRADMSGIWSAAIVHYGGGDDEGGPGEA